MEVVNVLFELVETFADGRPELGETGWQLEQLLGGDFLTQLVAEVIVLRTNSKRPLAHLMLQGRVLLDDVKHRPQIFSVWLCHGGLWVTLYGHVMACPTASL